jgi:hypothetical protein
MIHSQVPSTILQSYTSLFGDTCFEVRISGAMYPIVLGVEVEANVI